MEQHPQHHLPPRLETPRTPRDAFSECEGDFTIFNRFQRHEKDHRQTLVVLAAAFLSALVDRGHEKRREEDRECYRSELLSLFQHATLSPSLPFQRHKSHILTPARRCGRLMENCFSHLPCCDPCASCRCRLFNTICHCWRMNPLCLKRT
ncbi:hypothetical protein CCH79_00011233 [Gambusia affinis]|uniref:Agouti domain-containing protein n=1 Tax=Gambusia affinis TaxID=33528 RepID=A0A315V4I5_GAMAF|nr:hypothetical protein CCH79_00011233 [Gambusia affinis]